jgi:hypothetical protein
VPLISLATRVICIGILAGMYAVQCKDVFREQSFGFESGAALQAAMGNAFEVTLR